MSLGGLEPKVLLPAAPHSPERTVPFPHCLQITTPWTQRPSDLDHVVNGSLETTQADAPWSQPGLATSGFTPPHPSHTCKHTPTHTHEHACAHTPITHTHTPIMHTYMQSLHTHHTYHTHTHHTHSSYTHTPTTDHHTHTQTHTHTHPDFLLSFGPRLPGCPDNQKHV